MLLITALGAPSLSMPDTNALDLAEGDLVLAPAFVSTASGDRLALPVHSTAGEARVEGDHVYRKTELVGSSGESLSDAIETAIARAAKTLRHVEWFEVSEIRGQVRDGKVAYYQVTLKVGFRIEE